MHPIFYTAVVIAFTLLTASAPSQGQTYTYDNQSQLRGAALVSPEATRLVVVEVLTYCTSIAPQIKNASDVAFSRWIDRHQLYLDASAALRKAATDTTIDPELSKEKIKQLLEIDLPRLLKSQKEAALAPLRVAHKNGIGKEMCQSYIDSLDAGRFDLKNHDPQLAAFYDKEIVVLTRAEAENQRHAKFKENLVTSMQACWMPPENHPREIPLFQLSLNRDGSLKKEPELMNASDDPHFSLYAKSVSQAIQRCAPFNTKNYQDIYQKWEKIIVSFKQEEVHSERQTNSIETQAILFPGFKDNGRKAHALTLRKDLPDDRILLALFLCGQEDSIGQFAVGVDFGVGARWKSAQQVSMKFGGFNKTYSMQPVQEYLGLDGKMAAHALSKLTVASGVLEFSGPDGVSATFSLNQVAKEIAKFRALCKF